jgi:Bacterial protein of unknown function (DUF899)
MPWMAVDRKYEFDGPQGKVSLLDLFEGRQQLVVYRAFFEPASTARRDRQGGVFGTGAARLDPEASQGDRALVGGGAHRSAQQIDLPCCHVRM